MRKLVKPVRAEIVSRPGFATEGPKRGVARTGLVYEKKFADYVVARCGEERVLHNPWIRYEDEEGKTGYACPDVVLLPESAGGPLVVFEVKLTYTPRAAKMQLTNVYLPLVKILWTDQDNFRIVQVCNNLTTKAKDFTTNIPKVINGEGDWDYTTLNWRSV